MANPPLAPQTIKFQPIIHTGTMQGVRFSILLQGEPGSGKTYFMASCPDPFFLVWDTNVTTHDRLGLRYSLVRSWEETQWWLDVVKKRRLSEVVGAKVQTLCLDTLSSLGTMTSMEIADGHAKLGSRDKWDEYYSRLHQTIRTCSEATKPDNAHPQREVYWVIAGVHEEPVYETVGESKRLVKVKASVAGRMANANELYSHYSAHFLLETEERIVPTSASSKATQKERIHQMRTKGYGGRYCMPDKIFGRELPEVLPNNWGALMKAGGIENP